MSVSSTDTTRSARPKSRVRAPKSGRSSRGFIVGGAAIMILLGGGAILINAMQAHDPLVSDGSRHQVGTITLAPEGEFCRQLAFDNTSGRMVEVGRIKCMGSDSGDPAQRVRDRYSGGRLEAIRKSFSGGR